MLARTSIYPYHVGCRQRHRSAWYARYATYERDRQLRAKGDLYNDRGLVREGFDVRVAEGVFSVDIGTGSGVKLRLIHDPAANEV